MTITGSTTEIWVLVEHRKRILRPVSFELLAWAMQITRHQECNITAIVLSDYMEDCELNELIYSGADRVISVCHPALAEFLVEPYASALVQIIQKYNPEIFITAATTTGRTIMPYVAAKIHTGLTADCTGLKIEEESGLLLQTRPAIWGNILATIKTPYFRPQMATVRPHSIAAPSPDTSRNGEIMRIDNMTLKASDRVFLQQLITDEGEASHLEDAKIVVSGGKGLKNKQNFHLIASLAKELGGGIATSRPPVDQAWMPYAAQVGLSGKTISPDVYIACGISGSVQHLAGIQSAKNIIAINNDPQAQIFSVSDFGIVVDVFAFLPVLTEKLRAFKNGKRKD